MIVERFSTDPLAWYLDAACLEVPNAVALFFPERGQSWREAKAVCASCLVRDECLQYALDNGIHFGIWGGTSERERKSRRRARGNVAA